MERYRLSRLLLFLILIANSLLIAIFSTTYSALGNVEPYKLEISEVYIRNNEYYPDEIEDCKLREELPIEVYICNDNDVAVDCYLHISIVEGECDLLPQSDFNLTIPPGYRGLLGWYSGEEKITFIVIPSVSGKLFLELQLLYNGEIVDSFTVNFNVRLPSVYISDTATSLQPNPAFQNETCKLKVAVYNEENFPVAVLIKAYGKDLTLVSMNQKNITLQHGYNDIIFTLVSPNITGTFSVVIELWYQEFQIDTFSTTLKVVQPEVLYMPQEIWGIPLILFAVVALLCHKFLYFDVRKSLIWGIVIAFAVNIIILSFYLVKVSQRAIILQSSYIYTYLVSNHNYVWVSFSSIFLLMSMIIAYKFTHKLKLSLCIGIIATAVTSTICYLAVNSRSVRLFQFTDFIKAIIVKWGLSLGATALLTIITITGVIMAKNTEARRSQHEAIILRIAKLYGGILTATQVSLENKSISIKQARKYLDALVKMGEARKIEIAA